MSVMPLLSAPLEIQIHATSAMLAIALGPVAIYRQRRDRIHKTVGYIWVVAMVSVAITSFWIHTFAVIGPFSPLHGLALLALWSVYEGMRHAFAGRIAAHRAAMTSLYWNGLLVAGLFNFLPGRTINRMVFPETPQAGYWVMAAVGGVIALRLGRHAVRRAALSRHEQAPASGTFVAR